ACHEITRTKPLGSVAVAQRLFTSSQVAQCKCEQPVGHGEIRIKGKRLLKFHDGIARTPRPREYKPHGDMRPWVIGIQEQCLVCSLRYKGQRALLLVPALVHAQHGYE